MPDPEIAYYSVVQYVPDATRGERVNIGVLATNQAGTAAGAKFLHNWSRVRQFGREDISFLREFAQWVENQIKMQPSLFEPPPRRWNVDLLNQMGREWQNSIQLVPAKPSTLSMSDLVERMYERLVKEPAPRQRGFRDKRSATHKAVRAVKRAVIERLQRPEAAERVKTREWIKGSLDEHRFDLVVQNEHPLVAAQGLSFEVPYSPEMEKDIDALAWAVDDISRTDLGPTVSIIALPPQGKSAEYDRARRIYEELGATFVLEHEIDPWAADVAAKLA